MKIDRLISIIMILLEKERISAQELAATFEVSPRTIYRDINTINLSGVPVYSVPGVGGGFEIMQKYKIDNNFFSSTDISTILLGLSSISNMMQGNEIVNALAKVKHFIPTDKSNDIELKSNQIYIDLSPWMGSRNIQAYLEIIKSALQEKKLLSFSYADRYGNKTIRTVEPYQLVLKNSDWYWQGYCLIRNDFRLFKISRMSSLHINEKNFIPREYQPPNLNFDDVLKTMQTKIKLRIHKSIMDRVLEFCTYNCFSPDDSEHYIVNFPFIENEYYYNILFNFGNKCECLEPLHIRTEIKHRIHQLASLYENKQNK